MRCITLHAGEEPWGEEEVELSPSGAASIECTDSDAEVNEAMSLESEEHEACEGIYVDSAEEAALTLTKQ